MRNVARSLFLLLICFVSLALNHWLHGDEARFLRYPAVSNDGTLAFSYHGDIWVADSDGSNPRRLTAHIARDTFPRFSPDGQTIAFNSDRMGNDDVWLVPVAGGQPRQLTKHTTGDSVQYWTPDGNAIVIASSRGAGAWGSPLYVAPLDGKIPEPMSMDRGAAGMIRQDGKIVAFNRGGFRYWRKHYRGNNNTDIWIQDLASKEIKQLTDLDMKEFRDHTQDAYPMWGADGKIYFMSERDGIFNIWRIAADGTVLEQVTNHDADGIQYPSISPDGSTIVYENEFSLWKLSVPDGKTERIAINLSFDPKDNLIEFTETEDNASGFSPSADGQSIAVNYHGEIFLVPVDSELGEKTQITSSAWRDQNQFFSPDGKTLAYFSDQSGDEEIWLYDLESHEHRQLTKQESIKRSATWSPDSKQILFVADNKLHLVDVESGDLSEIAHNPEGGYSGVNFSVDGRWLAYSRSNSDLNSDCYLFDIENRKEYNITDHRFSEFGGELTADGSHYVFASDRTGDYQLYAVSLSKMTEDPDDPLVKKAKAEPKKESKKKEEQPEKDPEESDEDKAESGEDEATADEEETEGEEKEDEKPQLEVAIDLDRIEDRPRRLTSHSSGVRGFLMSNDGKTVYYLADGGLQSIGIDGKNQKKISDGSFGNLTLSTDGKSFFYSSQDGIFKMATNGSGKKQIKFSLRVKIDKPAEWEQIFEESWRVMKYRFYDENMHGMDWDGIKARYKPLLKYVGENQDLYDLCNEMIGELNASHTGVSGPPTRSMDSLYSTRNLGFELESHGEYFQVSHIYPNGPADKEWLDLNVGDYVLKIEDQNIRQGSNYYEALNNLLNDYVDIVVSTPGESADEDAVVLGEERKMRIRSTSSVRNLKYEAWVENNRKKVDKLSGGKIGYVHIRSMNQSSLARFETEINQFWNKNGMVIDIRYNGGGNIDQQLIDILERRPYEYWNSRGGGRARGRRPRQAIAGPQVMLINWRSASDSEVTPQAFRDLELGRIVGNPTYGAVIATGSYRLINGARIRTPGALVVTYDPSQPNNYGINLENFGVAPDVWVENSPQDELEGNDRELEAAVKEALKMLAEGDWQFGEDD